MPRLLRVVIHSSTPFLLGLLAFMFMGPLAPDRAEAQNVVVAKFKATKKSRKAANSAWAAIGHALKRQDARLVAYKQYLAKARKKRLKARAALRPKGVRKMARQLNLAGVVTGSVKKKKRRYVVTINVMSAKGKMVLKKAYRLKRPKFPRKLADELAALIVQKLGGQQVVAQADPKPKEVKKADPKDQEGDKGASTSKDAFLPAWARGDKKEDPAPAPTPTPVEKDEPQPEAEDNSVAAQAGPKAKKRKAGSVNDILVAAGGSFHHRAGLDPRHEASIFPGIRVDGHLYLGAFLDTPVVRDIGFGGMFDMSMGLEYGYSGGGADSWKASQMQWRAELDYRLALETGLSPAFIFHFGYGSTACKINSGSDPMALSSSYTAPYAGLDIYLMLWDPMVRFFVSGSFMFLVATGEDIKGDGMGFNVMGGLDFDIIDAIHLGIGYDLSQYMMKDNSTGGMGKYSDTYQGFFVRVGYNYN